MTDSKLLQEDVLQTAAQCRHYAMCKIDFLSTGIYPPATATPFVAFFPQGRMDICVALAKDIIPVTKTVADIIDSCNLCARCDIQCHFITGLRPMTVMGALKGFLADYRKKGALPVEIPADSTLVDLLGIVGYPWASNDPGILITYADDPYPLAGPQQPRYVVLPKTAEELAHIVGYARENDIAFVIRGNGGSVFGFVFTDGIVIDVGRMKDISIDVDNWSARVQPGVTSFELQKAAVEVGLRANTAEPAATVCGNVVCTGLFSTWANVYGVGADNYVDMTFLDDKGSVFRLNERRAPSAFGFENTVSPSPETLADAMPEDLRETYVKLYRNPHLTDMVWLNMFRIVSSRMSRHKHMFAFLVYVPLNHQEVIMRILEQFAAIADRHAIAHDFGFLTPLDLGKRAILEYDYYIDHTSAVESEKIRRAMTDIEPMLDGMSAAFKGVKWLKYIFSQGCARKESYLYS